MEESAEIVELRARAWGFALAMYVVESVADRASATVADVAAALAMAGAKRFSPRELDLAVRQVALDGGARPAKG